MALLNFNYGLVKDLPSKITDGYLYITTDSQGLYVDLEGVRTHISDFIQVESVEALNALGTYYTEVFYYVTGSNALMKYTAEGTWKQLNSTADLQQAITDLTARVKKNEDDIVALKTADININERIDNLNATDIETTQEITVTTAVGNYAKGAKIDKDTDLQTLILNMLCKDSNPTTTQPSLTITLTDAGSKEVGTSFAPSYSASGNAGKYVANGVTQQSGVTFSNYSVTEVNRPDALLEETKSEKSGSFTGFTVKDDMDYYLTATVDHSAGVEAKTYLGNPYPSGTIQAGSKSNTSSHITGYRPIFYGMSTATGALDSAAIRGLTNQGSAPAAATITLKASTMPGVKRFIIAIPNASGLNVTKAIITSSQNADATADYVKQTATVEVQGANGYTTTKPYKVWIYEPASIADVEVHEITIG